MPELSTEFFYHCVSAEYCCKEVVGSQGDKYTVEFSSTPNGSSQYDWSCTCLGYQYRGKCKHIEAVKKDKDYCGWMQFKHGSEPIEINGEKRCPICKGEVVLRAWAV